MRSLKFEAFITKKDDEGLKRYFKDINRYDRIDAAQETVLSERIRLGDQRALDALVLANLKFVVACAKQYQYMGMPLSDLINEGNIGLIKAASHFDPTRGFKFTSYAIFWIRERILNALSLDNRIVRAPKNQFLNNPTIRELRRKLEQRLEREPTLEEMQEDGTFSFEILRLNADFEGKTISLHAPVTDGESELLELMEDAEAAVPDDHLIRHSLRTEAESMLNLLKPKHRKVLYELYGFGDLPLSTVEVADRNGLTPSRIRQINDEAISQIRNALKL